MSRNIVAQDSHEVRWVDGTRGFALIAIVVVHIAEKLYKPFELKDGVWVTQAIESTGSATQDWLRTISQWSAFIGDQFVGVFLVLSGFLAVYSIQNATQVNWLQVTMRRLIRVLIPWWWVHLLILTPMAFFGVRASLHDWQFWASFAGIRCTVDSMYYAIGAWWYVPLLLQLILVTPVLYRAMMRLGPVLFAGLCIALGYLARTVGWYQFLEHIDLVGSIFIFRLPEFAVGMAIAQAWNSDLQQRLISFKSGVLFLLLGIALQSAWGWPLAFIFLPLPLSLLWFGLLLNLTEGLRKHSIRSVRTSLSGLAYGFVVYLGRNSLWIYLVHHPIVGVLTPREPDVSDIPKATVRIFAGIVLSIAAAKVIELSLLWVRKQTQNSIARFGKKRFCESLAAVFAIGLLMLVGIEACVRQWAPQDSTTQGWAERRVLIADPKVDWKLRSDSTTRLRWESYDYIVQSNSLGYPRTEELNPESKNVKRIMVLGDAFSSAEGVDTLKAWPNLLQQELNNRNVMSDDVVYEVNNFAITGYGPNQYEKVLREYLPTCKPNLVLIEFFINDLIDVEQTTADTYDSIGFGTLSEEHPLCWLSGRHTAAFVRRSAASVIYGALGRPTPHTEFLAMLELMEREPTAAWQRRKELFLNRLSSMQELCKEANCKLLALIVPAGSQVAPLDELTYMPRDFRFEDQEHLDLEQPQRIISEALSQEGIVFIDLRTWLTGKAGLYQPANLHWTYAAHKLVSEELAAWLLGRSELTDQ